MKPHSLPFVLALLFCTLLPLGAQTPEWSEYASASAVRDIAEEGQYLWLATETGLVRFDKQAFTGTQYTLHNSGLPAVYLTSIAADRDGVKWIGSWQGLVRYDGTDWEVFDTSNSPLTTPVISDVAIDRDNAVWIANSNEVARFSNGSWEVYTFPCITYVNALYPAPDGSMWIGCNYAWESCQSAYVLRDGELLPVSDDFADRSVQAITGRNNSVWFTTNQNQTKYTGTLISYNGIETEMYTWETMGFAEPAPIVAASLDSADNIWVISQYGIYGMAGYDGTSWTFFNADNSPLGINHRMNMLMTDSDGILWIGTSLGLLYYDGAQWREFPSLGLHLPPLHNAITFALDTNNSVLGFYYENFEPELADSCFYLTEQGWKHQPFPVPDATEITIDHEGNRWVSTWSGDIYRQKDGVWELMRSTALYSKLFVNSRNELWTTRMEKFDGNEWTTFPLRDSAWFTGCSAIAEDRHGTMWFGTTHGLVSYDGTTWTSYRRDRADMPDVGLGTLVMACDSADNIWLGSASSVGAPARGLYRFSNGEWYPHVGPFDSTASIQSIATDRGGNLWVASGGLRRFDGSEWTRFDATNSPVPSWTRNLIVDSENTVWMQASTGILAYHQGMPVSVQDIPAPLTDVALEQNHPNPAAAATAIRYTLPATAGQQRVQLTVWNTLGVRITTLVDAVQTPGSYQVNFDTGSLPPGVYYYQLQAAGTTVSRQMVVVR